MYGRALAKANTDYYRVRVLNHDLPFRLGYGQVLEGSMEMLRIRETLNGHHPCEDLYAPACVDVVLQGRQDRRVFLDLFLTGLLHLCWQHVRKSRHLLLGALS